MSSTTDTIIFLGPSLPLDDAKAILPHAAYLPPVGCGDLIRALRLKPKVIAIIDGLFENTAAVWHKEILYALEQGVAILGASSMGALRAAELHPLGMQGFGKVFNAYASGKINDDDEVAILHSSAEFGFTPLTDAMINIRTTLKQALVEEVIDKDIYSTLLSLSKSLFYRERSLTRALALLEEQGASCEPLRSWLMNGNYIDQKQLDAKQLLNYLASNPLIEVSKSTHCHSATFLRKLHKKIMCRPFPHDYDFLPEAEKVALTSRILGEHYHQAKRLAMLMSLTDSLADELAVDDKPSFEFDYMLGGANTQRALIKRIQRLSACSTYTFKTKTDFDNAYKENQLHFMRLYGHYTQHSSTDVKTKLTHFKQALPIDFNLLHYQSLFWVAIQQRLISLNISVDKTYLQGFANSFRQKRGLLSRSSTQLWLHENHLDIEGFNDLITMIATFNFLVDENNTDILGVSTKIKSHWWLLDALIMTGLYDKAKALMQMDAIPKAIIEQHLQALNDQGSSYAYALDFTSGEEGLRAFLQR